MVFEKIIKLGTLQFIVVSSLFLLLSGFIYDWIVGEVACVICMTQRLILVFICLCTLGIKLHNVWAKVVQLFCGLGILLGFRHIYVVAFPEQVTQCMPLDFILTLPGSQFWEAILSWVGQMGRECGESVTLMTYFLIVVLFVYYITVLYLIRKDRLDWK